MSLPSLIWRHVLDPRPEGSTHTWYPAREETTVRVVIPGARVRLGDGQPRLVRLGLLPLPRGLITPTMPFGYVLGRVVLGHRSLALDAEPWDYDGNQVTLTFGGDTTAATRAGEVCVSDPVPLALAAGQDLVLSVVLSGAGEWNQYLPCVSMEEGTGARLYLGPGRRACQEAAPRGLAEFVDGSMAEAKILPFVATVEVADGESLPVYRAAAPVWPVAWDGVEVTAEPTRLHLRIPGTALELPSQSSQGGQELQGLRLVLQPGEALHGVPWEVTAARLGTVDGESVAVTFAGQPGVTVAPGVPTRSDVIPLPPPPSSLPDSPPHSSPGLLLTLDCPAGAAIPRHARGLLAPQAGWAWWHAPQQAEGEALLIPGDGAPLALAGLECVPQPTSGGAPVYEVLGGNVGYRRTGYSFELPAGSHVRLLLPRQALATADAAALPASASQARLALCWHDLPWVSGIPDAGGGVRCWTLAGLRVGFAAHGALHTFEAAPVPVPFPGRDYPVAVDGPLVSDWFDLPRPWTPADRLLVALELAQPLRPWHVSGGWQAVWNIWEAPGSAAGALAPPPGGFTPAQWVRHQTNTDYWLHTGQQPFVRRVEVRP